MPARSERHLRVLHVVPGLWEHTGGPAESIPALCEELLKKDCSVTLATLDGPMSERVLESSSAGVSLRLFRPSVRGLIWYSQDMARRLPLLAREADVVHTNGLWGYPVWLAARLAAKFGKPLVMTVRGALDPEALKISGWKKALSGALFDNRFLRGASCLHAMSERELAGIRGYGLKNNVAVIPSGVDLAGEDSPARGDALARFPGCRGKRILLAASRIHPIKGLTDLAEAWGEVAGRYRDWRLLMVGPDEGGHIREILRVLELRKVSPAAAYGGIVNKEELHRLFAASSLFISPTRCDSFGMSIAEALWTGLPVITTYCAPWEGVLSHACGWYVPAGKDGLVSALEQALARSEDDLREMGLRGQRWVRSAFTHDRSAGQMSQLYRWLLGAAARPECVRVVS